LIHPRPFIITARTPKPTINNGETKMSELLAVSARNQFKGTVAALNAGMVNTEVIVDAGDGLQIAAVVTKESAFNLDLSVGKEVYAFFKASQVTLSREKGLKTSARNNFKGKVKDLRKGAVNSEVLIALPSKKIVAAIVTNGSAERLKLAAGLEISALVKAFHVILAVKESQK
jgi:molybdate transport system regulatory protein